MQTINFVPSLDLTSDQESKIFEFLNTKYTDFIRNNVNSQALAVWELLVQYLEIISDTRASIINILVSSFLGGSNLLWGKMESPLVID